MTETYRLSRISEQPHCDIVYGTGHMSGYLDSVRLGSVLATCRKDASRPYKFNRKNCLADRLDTSRNLRSAMDRLS